MLFKRRQMQYLLAAVIAAALVAAAGCRNTTPADEGKSLAVAAAANLAQAFTEVGEAFYAETGCNVQLSLGSSGLLAQQIENGAPFDIYAAADEAFISRLRSKNMLLEDTVEPYALGNLVLARHEGQMADLDLGGLDQLLDARVKKVAIANPEHAPYGRAAKEALVNAGLWEEIEPRLVFGNNIIDTLNLVKSGNTEMGIVALSLVISDTAVTYRQVDSSLYRPLRQMIAVVSGTGSEEEARKFILFINSDRGRSIMSKYGFLPPDGEL
jgi:molybdate transport system substrate-binding protein